MAFRAGGLVLLVVIVQGVFCFPRSAFIHHMYEAREMLHVTSDHKMRDYVGYGNYCGMGGSGPVLDPIDMCCKIHDDCYGEITSLYGNLCDPHKGSYEFTVSRNTHTLGCADGFNLCGRDVCICDERLVGCWQKYDMYYDRFLIRKGHIAKSLLMTSIGLLTGK